MAGDITNHNKLPSGGETRLLRLDCFTSFNREPFVSSDLSVLELLSRSVKRLSSRGALK